MEKDIVVDKLKDFCSFLLCFVVILAIAYFSGFLKGFTPADFQDAYNRLLSYVPQVSSNTYAKHSNNTTRYKDYLPSYIPDSVLRSAKDTGTYSEIFNSNTKSVYYVYDDYGKDIDYTIDFHNRFQNYISRNSLKTYYDIRPYTLYLFHNMRVGVTGPTNICKSLAECKAQRDHAADYSSLQAFFNRCAKTMCIINPAKKQFIVLKKRDYESAVKMLNDLKGW